MAASLTTAYPSIAPQTAKVVVIEDNLDNMELITSLLREDVGVYYCNTRPSGHTFFSWFQDSAHLHSNPHLRQLDLVLLDLQIPREDGYAVIKKLRTLPELRQTRIIAVTANVMAQDVTRCRESGFDGFIGKPISVDRFPVQICRILAGEPVWEPR
jgi:two-component system, cell cycle response regulator DivK